MNRHPLQELVVDTFVPNDVHIVGGTNEVGTNDGQDNALGEEAPNVVICTGANACGKVLIGSLLPSVLFLKCWTYRAFT